MKTYSVRGWARTARTAVLIVAAAIAATLTLAAPAQADQYDYIALLDNEGVFYTSITDVIDHGKMACRLLRGGAGVPTTLNYVAGGGYVPYEAGIIVASAALNMCPDTMPVVSAFANGTRV